MNFAKYIEENNIKKSALNLVLRDAFTPNDVKHFKERYNQCTEKEFEILKTRLMNSGKINEDFMNQLEAKLRDSGMYLNDIIIMPPSSAEAPQDPSSPLQSGLWDQNLNIGHLDSSAQYGLSFNSTETTLVNDNRIPSDDFPDVSDIPPSAMSDSSTAVNGSTLY